MISKALVFIKNHLNTHLSMGWSLENSHEDIVVFVDGEQMDPINFKLGSITALLINIEEENTLRSPDPYIRPSVNGVPQRVNPEIRLNLYILFVARFKQYEESLRYLSRVITHFQTHRLLNQHNAPELSDDIEQLIMELITLPFSEQNEVWSALRTAYHPSVLYKVKLVVFRDEDAVELPQVAEKTLRISS